MDSSSGFLPSLGLVALATMASAQSNLDVIQRVDANDLGLQATLPSRGISISADGHFAAFSTLSDNLIPGDSNLVEDVYLRNLVTGGLSRVSLNAFGGQLTQAATRPEISGDGRFVAFESADPLLVSGDGNAALDVFLCDTTDGSILRASVMTGGGEVDGTSCEPALSEDGIWLAFASDAPNLCGAQPHPAVGGRHIFLRNRYQDRTWRVSLGQPGMQLAVVAANPAISEHGRYVVFEARNMTLQSGLPPGSSQIYSYDVQTDSVTLISRDDMGQPANADSKDAAVSSNGRFVAYSSLADNLVAGDTNGVADIFLFDRVKQITRRVSIGSLGGEANGMSYKPSLSADGRFAAFTSLATNLSALAYGGDRAVFVRDNDLGVLQLVSINSEATPADQSSTTTNARSLSDDGRYVVFESSAGNLVSGPLHYGTGVYVFDRRNIGPRLTSKLPLAGERVWIEASGVVPFGPLILGLSASGQGPLASPWGLIDLSLPMSYFAALADGSGRLSIELNVPSSMAGLAFYAQALDVFGSALSNPLAVLVQ